MSPTSRPFPCPLISESRAPLYCPVRACMHFSKGRCNIAQSLEGDAEKIASLFDCTQEDILKNVEGIKLAIVADAWFEEITNSSVLTGTSANFDECLDPRQARAFDAWNKSPYSFDQVRDMLRVLAARRGTS